MIQLLSRSTLRKMLLPQAVLTILLATTASAIPQWNAPSQTVDVDVAIVGAGLSGLTAAYHLQKKGVTNFMVVEERDRVGGRTDSKELRTAHGTDKWDLGGQWVSSNQTNIIALAKELNIKTFLQFNAGQSVFFFPDGTVKLHIPDQSPLSRLQSFLFQAFIIKVNYATRQVSTSTPEDTRYAEEWDSITVEEFMRQSPLFYADKVLRGTFSNLVTGIFTSHPNELSLLFFLQVCASGGGFLNLASSAPGAAQESKVDGTAHRISLSLLDKIGKNKVMLGNSVTAISETTGGRQLVKTEGGQTLQAKFVIVAASPHARARIDFPNLPIDYHHLNLHYVSGLFIKVILTYSTAFWRGKGLAGSSSGATIPLSPSGRTNPSGSTPVISPVLVSYDASLSDGTNFHPALVVFIHPMSVNDKDLEKNMLDQLVSFFGKEAANPIDTVFAKWFGRDTPVVNASPGALVNFGKLIRRPAGSIHWAGSETATEWIGYMDGAVQSGRRAAEEVLAKL